MHRVRSLALLALLLCAARAFCQTPIPPPYYSRLNSFGVFGEYSNDSSHILLGTAENRRLLNFGGTYSRRVLLNGFVDGQYMLELRPVMLESDPVETLSFSLISQNPPGKESGGGMGPPVFACHTLSESETVTRGGTIFVENISEACGRRWTFGEGFSPIGFKWNFRPQHRVQPVITMLGGYMFSTQQIPVMNSGSANFTFEIGAGFEFYRSARRSLRAEYRYHHISNAGTAAENPGIDSGLFQVTYAFGH